MPRRHAWSLNRNIDILMCAWPRMTTHGYARPRTDMRRTDRHSYTCMRVHDCARPRTTSHGYVRYAYAYTCVHTRARPHATAHDVTCLYDERIHVLMRACPRTAPHGYATHIYVYRCEHEHTRSPHRCTDACVHAHDPANPRICVPMHTFPRTACTTTHDQEWSLDRCKRIPMCACPRTPSHTPARQCMRWNDPCNTQYA
jgi:hypothetical protein